MSDSIKSLISNNSSRNSIKKNETMMSENIDMSQLENIANLKKLNRKDESINVSEFKKDNSPVSTINNDLSSLKENDDHKKYKSNVSSSDMPTYKKKKSLSSSESSSNSDINKRREKNYKRALRENKDEQIRKEKAALLHKLHLFGQKKDSSSYGYVKLDLNYTLDEIKFEFNRIKGLVDNERMVNFYKRMLLMGIQGVEMLNSTFDPFGIDLNGWSEAMGYSMENQEYDEVLSDLYEKYKGTGSMSPEMKLIFMIITSGFMFTASKKIAKMDSSSMFANILGNFMNNKGQDVPTQASNGPSPQDMLQQMQMQQQREQQMQQQMHMQQLQQIHQQQMQQQQQQQQQQQMPVPMSLGYTNAPPPFLGRNMTMNQDMVSDNTVDSDQMPSKIRPPPTLNTNELEKIMKTMNDAKAKKQEEQLQKVAELTESEIILKPIPPLKKKGGRPRKVKM